MMPAARAAEGEMMKRCCNAKARLLTRMGDKRRKREMRQTVGADKRRQRQETREERRGAATNWMAVLYCRWTLPLSLSLSLPHHDDDDDKTNKRSRGREDRKVS